MRVLFVSAEVAPYSKTGGLADVAAALPAALADLGQDVMVVTPLYDTIDPREHRLHLVYEDIEVRVGDKQVAFSARLAPDGRTWFIDLPDLYHRGSIYTQDRDEHLRFLLLTRAAFELCRHRQWSPDIAHGNDWHTGFLPLLLRSVYVGDNLFRDTQSVFTIHNLAYQGWFDAGILPDLGLGAQQYLLHQDHLRQGHINFMEHALLYADLLTTVSPTYAWEIQTPELGAGLDFILRKRSHDLVGILNGIDTTVWNPETDRHLFAPYSALDMAGKQHNKRALLLETGLEDETIPLVGIVSRLTAQKGIELLIRPIARLLELDAVRFVGIGTGEKKYEEALVWLSHRYPGKAQFLPVYDERLAHLIEAGADMFAMPSRYEPSGLNQMYSLAYGTPPIVRRTGGLADTVRHYDPATGDGNGFAFEHYSEEGFHWALGEAVRLFPDRDLWERLQQNGMSEDNSWERRAGEYLAAYQTVMENVDQ
ncbi:MAG: glycogen synthase [Acidimicrobiia bacterium]